jgi:hypothetical protein
MGLMDHRRRADAKKQIAVNKAKAHADNHARVHAKVAKDAADAEAGKPQPLKAENADEHGTK